MQLTPLIINAPDYLAIKLAGSLADVLIFKKLSQPNTWLIVGKGNGLELKKSFDGEKQVIIMPLSGAIDKLKEEVMEIIEGFNYKGE